MINNFEINFEGACFEFNTLNRVKHDAFQVYVFYDNKKVRFHMQMAADGNFHITDLFACPEIFHPLEQKLSDAIFEKAKG